MGAKYQHIYALSKAIIVGIVITPNPVAHLYWQGPQISSQLSGLGLGHPRLWRICAYTVDCTSAAAFVLVLRKFLTRVWYNIILFSAFGTRRWKLCSTSAARFFQSACFYLQLSFQHLIFVANNQKSTKILCYVLQLFAEECSASCRRPVGRSLARAGTIS